MPAEGGLAEEVDAPFPATAGELALLLALCAALSLAALTILAILLRRKRYVKNNLMTFYGNLGIYMIVICVVYGMVSYICFRELRARIISW